MVPQLFHMYLSITFKFEILSQVGFVLVFVFFPSVTFLLFILISRVGTGLPRLC